MNDWFEWNGARSTEYDVHVTDQPSIIVPSERVTFTQIPARSGTLTQLEADEVYDDFILSVDCCVSDLSRLTRLARGSAARESWCFPNGRAAITMPVSSIRSSSRR